MWTLPLSSGSTASYSLITSNTSMEPGAQVLWGAVDGTGAV